MFVKALAGQSAIWGIGKQVDHTGDYCTVEYFDMPTSEPVTCKLDSNLIKPVLLVQQTRVYHFDEIAGTWEIGRLLEDHGDRQLIQFPNGKAKYLDVGTVFVRWAKPIQDPTPLLANRINESPRFSDGRSAFIRSQTRQRAASMGMSALLASAIELEAHQIEVVRRILQDPVQRYLLADEVGLGKTIEAGVLIRQCILDTREECSILVIVPPALVGQWKSELANRFFLRKCLDKSIHVVALDNENSILAHLPRTMMLVIDEAHHLTKRLIGGVTGIYADIAAAAPAIDRVLLLSATPVLHNERGFLEMLHLLDPATYPLDGEDAFRRKVESRQTLAEIVAGLTPENALYLDYTIDQLATLFPDDQLLHEHAETLRIVIEMMPGPDDPALVEAIGRLRAHLSEVYRLHRRILRNRRQSIGGLTPDRSGAEIIRYRSSDRIALTAAIEDWRFDEAVKLDASGSEKLWDDRVRAFWQVIDRAAQYPNSGPGLIGYLACQTAMIGDPERFAMIKRCLGHTGLFEDRAQALLGALAPLVRSHTQCVIFCSDRQTADALAQYIRNALKIMVDRHDPEDDAWTAFTEAADHPVLVCDRRAEEGLNLQGGKKVIIHYDVPFNPNRIEQRLGRADRYGSGEAVRSLVLGCEDDPLEMAWIDYLDTALRVFNRSVASLQYLIEQTVRDIARALFTDGAEALTDLTASSAGDDGLIEREIRSIDRQDALDALGAPPGDFVDALSEVDEDWQTIADETATWLDRTLHFTRIEEKSLVPGTSAAVPFRYVYSISSRRHTLISLLAFKEQCENALDVGHGRIIQTIPYTFRRRTALNRNARANGVGLLRYGDPLISGMTVFTEADDRGRSFAMWRFVPDHTGAPPAQFYFRFDFILEADITAASDVLAAHGRDLSAARAAIRRRGDMALAPFYRSVWLDQELAPVHDEMLLASLERPYNKTRPDSGGAYDLNLNSRRWQNLQQLQIPELTYWEELCKKARTVAEDVLRADPDLIMDLGQAEQGAARVDHGRIGQLRARVHAADGRDESAELAFEEQLAAALRNGINAPRVQLDTIGVVFISANQSVTTRVAGNL